MTWGLLRFCQTPQIDLQILKFIQNRLVNSQNISKIRTFGGSTDTVLQFWPIAMSRFCMAGPVWRLFWRGDLVPETVPPKFPEENNMNQWMFDDVWGYFRTNHFVAACFKQHGISRGYCFKSRETLGSLPLRTPAKKVAFKLESSIVTWLPSIVSHNSLQCLIMLN